MKTLEWQNFFAGQREQHWKVLFSTAELANAARTTLHAVNTELGRLMKRGIVRRYARGWYGPVQGVEAESILTAIDPKSLVTFRNLDALNVRRLEKVMRRYPEPVRVAIGRI
jgi:hypothetical protein